MSAPEEHITGRWWAEGDTPVHADSRVTYLVDGRAAILTMCIHFLKARRYIYMANWGITATMELVRGTDHRAGPDGSPEQEMLLSELRAESLQEADIAFWTTQQLSLQNVLHYAVSKGVEVRSLLWDCPEVFAHYSPKLAHEQLTQVGVNCLLDDSSHGILHHPAESLHQKIAIVDGLFAFVGGIDLLIEAGDDFDRWDTHSHPFQSQLRSLHPPKSPHPWHDAHSLLEGPIAGDVELNFRQRWNDVVQRHKLDANLMVPEHPSAPAIPSKTIAQVARTIPQHTYNFDPPSGIQGIAQLYGHALGNIERFLYVENQYFWLRAYIGLDIPLVSVDSPDMEYNIRKVGEALKRGAYVTIVLPDHPNVGRAFTDAGLERLKAEAPEAVAQGRLQVFCLATSMLDGPKARYRPIYVHAKVAIIDDLWTTVGSGNLNNRGMRDDTEMNVATFDSHLAQGLRLMLWGEHLGLIHDDDLLILSHFLGGQPLHPQKRARAEQVLPYLQQLLGNPEDGLRLMRERAQENLQHFKAGELLVGHLLPYLTAQEATRYGLNFREEHGWIEEEGADV